MNLQRFLSGLRTGRLNKQLLLSLVALACFTLTLNTADARPENKIYVTPEHDKHDLRRYSPDFDIKLKCKSVRWIVDEPTQWDVKFDIKDHRWGGFDKVLLEDLTHNSVTQIPSERSSLYVSGVEDVKKGFNLKVQCADADDDNH